MADDIEMDVMQHLLQVEKEADAIVEQAKKEADKRIIDAQVDFSAKYKHELESSLKSLQTDFIKQSDSLKKNPESVLGEYKKQLENKAQNKKEFVALLEKYLF